MLRSANKAKGNISSVFAHLGASTPEIDPRFLELKKQIAPKNPDVLRKAFDRVLNAMEIESQTIRQRGSAVIPEVTMEDIKANGGRLPSKLIPEVKKRGAVVVRNIVDRAVAAEYKSSIQDYIQRHPGIAGFPEDNPQVWEVYWSQAQVKARSHPNFTATAVALNHLWHGDKKAPINLDSNLVYCDRMRIRQPGDGKFTLAGHIDGGSLERWEDPEYRRCYTKILEGKWEEYDPYDVTHRIEANMDLYDAPGGCSMFRIFQGWLAISKITPGGGTLRVCPLVKEPTAYFMMKPLLEESMGTSNFMGAWPGRCQDITTEDHPHIVDSMVSVPEVDCGDGVFWHCDQIHAVEPKQTMKTDSSVLYIPSTPMCPRSSDYLRRQRAAFEQGLTPPDFPANDCEEHFDDRATPAMLTEEQKLGMGFAPFSETDGMSEGQLQAIRDHNRSISQ
ncbi:DUF1479 domain protein [Zychaea mexicana]|uniref:DUF1479 domain protein n=1 Tax=Zychaea mexicana TaxID=64656 RepID=UPI0022FDB74B|nr:DUF1479 domain protein [Zychaea mexicana]KAI9489915.1 DUF1479 domain protein [Zychaea mexicana]